MSESEFTDVSYNVYNISLDLIDVDTDQPRKEFSSEYVNELMTSIKNNGLQNPILVSKTSQGRYLIISGENRYRAFKNLGKETIPCIIKENIDPKLRLELQIIENTIRKNLTPIEEANAYKRLIDEYGYSQLDVADKIGKNRDYVAHKLRLLRLSPKAQDSLTKGLCTEGQLKPIITLDQDQQDRILDFILRNKPTARKVEEKIRELRNVPCGTSQEQNGSLIKTTLLATVRVLLDANGSLNNLVDSNDLIIALISDLKKLGDNYD